jgi:5-methylcytosine-specific restriction endonuclease McrA
MESVLILAFIIILGVLIHPTPTEEEKREEHIYPYYVEKEEEEEGEIYDSDKPLNFHHHKERGIDYNTYIHSVEWLEGKARIEALERSNYSCEACGTTYSLQVHHLNYRTLGEESSSDLAVLCEHCHSLLHQNYNKGDRDGNYPLSLIAH